MPILPGTDGEQRMSKSLGNYVGVTEPPEEVFGKLMRVPDAAMAVYYELLLEEAFDPARPAVESKRALARALTARFHGEEAAAGGGGSTSTACTSSARCPTRSRSWPSPPATAGAPARACCATPSASPRSEGRRLLAGGGVKLDGEPVPAGRARPGRRAAGRRGPAGRASGASGACASAERRFPRGRPRGAILPGPARGDHPGASRREALSVRGDVRGGVPTPKGRGGL